MDTDSCLYFTTPLLPDQIEEGPHTGDWSNELTAYARELRKRTGDPTAECTIRSFQCPAPKVKMVEIAPVKREYCGPADNQMMPLLLITCKVRVRRRRRRMLMMHARANLQGLSKNGYNKGLNMQRMDRLLYDADACFVGRRDDIKRNVVDMSLTSREGVERKLKRVQRKS